MSRRPFSAFVVAGTHSGVGKTTITLGLIAALRRHGLAVQPFKVGPDFIDPLHHAHASGRPPRNLDGWMLTPEVNRQRFARAVADADVAVIEGVMGLYDGSEGRSDRGSTAEMAKLLDLPVVLVVDASAMARSAAALVHGFVDFDRALKVAGVVLNQVGSAGHTGLLREALGDSTPILGAIPRSAELVVPERHLGLHLPHEARREYVEEAAHLVLRHLDIDRLLEIARVGRPAQPSTAAPTASPAAVRIGLARDEAFCFYYQDNLELLAEAGAELVEFSPLRDQLPARVQGLYFGGGYPELHAEALSGNQTLRSSIRDFAASGGPIYAECGGLMYLAEELCLETAAHPMCGVLPFSTVFPAGLTIAYVEVTTTGGLFGAGRVARGHLFHQSRIAGEARGGRCYAMETSRGERQEEGFAVDNVVASYAHLHFASSPGLAAAFVNAAAAAAKRGSPHRPPPPGSSTR